jgi:hypothetical protein
VRKLLLGLGVVSLWLVSAAQPVSATVTECVGTLPPGDYDSIVVQSGAACELVPGTNVGNNIRIEPGAIGLDATGVSVGSSVLGNQAELVSITDTAVGGTVHLANVARVFLSRSSAHTVDLHKLAAAAMDLSISTVMQLQQIEMLHIHGNGFKNALIANSGSGVIAGNRVGGNLLCNNNDAVIAVGNVVDGKDTCTTDTPH